MSGIRSKVAKKTASFIQTAQAQPPAVPPAAPPAPPAAPGDMAPKAPAPRPPIPAGPSAAPVAPPMGAPNIDQRIEQEKRQQQKMDNMEKTINTVNEKFDTLVNAVTDMKKVIEQTMLGKPDTEEKFKILKEKTNNPEEPNKTEFGLDEDKFHVSTEDRKMSAGNLREARKQRLEAADKDLGLKFHELKFEDKEHENKTYKQQVPAPQITKIKESEIPDLFRLIALDLNDAEDQWSVVNKNTEEIYYVINKSDQNQQEFATKAFALAVVEDMKTLGVEKAMEKNSAVKIKALDVDLVKAPPVKDELPPKGPDKPLEVKKGPLGPDGPGKDKKEELKEKLLKVKEKVDDKGMKPPMPAEDKPALPLPLKEDKEACAPTKMGASDYKRRFLRAFRLALAAQQKNLITNPMKAAWFRTLSDLGVDNPAHVIEATFSASAADHFEVALAKTDEFLNMSDEAFIETESAIGELKTEIPEVQPTVASVSKVASEMRERAMRSSIPLTTASAVDNDKQAALASVLPSPKLAGISRFAR